MEYGLTLSIRQFLDVYVPEANEVVLIRDGITLTGKAKPFLTVEYLGDDNESLSAGRTSYEETYRFQVGIRARDIAELLKMQGKVKTLLRRPDGIILYDDTAVATDKRFVVSVDGFTPIKNDDTSSDSENHRGYFDISVTLYRDTGDSAFTQ